jgi:endonuclease/exonuclease/phosphatase family metal-dependent hydrolase
VSRITVTTLNLHLSHDRWLERRHLIVSQLLDMKPDLIALQEVFLPGSQGRWLRHQINSRLTGSSRAPYRLVQKRRPHLLYGYLEGLAILSRKPVLAHDHVSLGYGGRFALRANIEVTPRRALDFVTVQLHEAAADQDARVEQVMRLMSWLFEPSPVPLQIVAGDFGEVPDGPAIRQMKQRYRSAMVDRWGHEPLATYPTALAGLEVRRVGCLDYIFLSHQVGPVVEASTCFRQAAPGNPTLYPSDHIGLCIEVEV